LEALAGHVVMANVPKAKEPDPDSAASGGSIGTVNIYACPPGSRFVLDPTGVITLVEGTPLVPYVPQAVSSPALDVPEPVAVIEHDNTPGVITFPLRRRPDDGGVPAA
jgi:hypothetical protein